MDFTGGDKRMWRGNNALNDIKIALLSKQTSLTAITFTSCVYDTSACEQIRIEINWHLIWTFKKLR